MSYTGPKVELHVHLDGAFDPERLWFWTKKYRSSLPQRVFLPWRDKTVSLRSTFEKCQTINDFMHVVSARGKEKTLGSMLDCFAMYLPIVRGNLDAIEDLTFHFCKQQADNNVIYTEVRYSPHELLSSSSTVSAEDVVICITKALSRGEKTFGITIKQILCCICSHPEWSAEVCRLAIAYKNDGVVGIDIASGEAHFDNKQLMEGHKKAMDQAKIHALGITIHAGEAGPPQNIITAMDVYHAMRIGHGYAVLKDNVILQRCMDSNIHFEVCPTSSFWTGAHSGDFTNHAATYFCQKGINFSINSDDPFTFDVNLSEEYKLCIEKMKISENQMKQCNLNAINASFASSEIKNRIRRQIMMYAKY